MRSAERRNSNEAPAPDGGSLLRSFDGVPAGSRAAARFRAGGDRGGGFCAGCVAGSGAQAGSAARSPRMGQMAMKFALCQALSLCLAWAAASPAESAPARGNPTTVTLQEPAPRLMPLWMSESGTAVRPQEGPALFALQGGSAARGLHPARIRGRAGCGAPGSSSRYLPATGASPSVTRPTRLAGELTDLRQGRGRHGRGGAVRGVSAAVPRSSGRALRPEGTSAPFVSSSLFQR